MGPVVDTYAPSAVVYADASGYGYKDVAEGYTGDATADGYAYGEEKGDKKDSLLDKVAKFFGKKGKKDSKKAEESAYGYEAAPTGY